MFVGTRVSTLVPLAEFARNLILGTFIEMCRENGSLVKIGPQMKLLRHLLGIKLDKEKNQCIRKKKNGSTEHSKENKTVPEKVATTRTEDGHKYNTQTSTTFFFFNVLLTVHLSIFILVINQLDPQCL